MLGLILCLIFQSLNKYIISKQLNKDLFVNYQNDCFTKHASFQNFYCEPFDNNTAHIVRQYSAGIWCNNSFSADVSDFYCYFTFHC